MDSLHSTPPDLLEAQRRQARIDLAAAHRLAVIDDYHEAIDNHFTLLVPGRPGRFYLNEFGLHWNEVTASNLIEVAFDGTVVEGTGAACVLHTHMPYATALSQLEDMTVEMTGQGALQFEGRIAYDYDYNGFAHEHAEGERMAALMGDKVVL